MFLHVIFAPCGFFLPTNYFMMYVLYTCTCMFVFLYVLYTCTCMFVFLYVLYTYTCMFVFLYALYTCTCMFVFLYVYIMYLFTHVALGAWVQLIQSWEKKSWKQIIYVWSQKGLTVFLKPDSTYSFVS
jgi:hypothetical protein